MGNVEAEGKRGNFTFSASVHCQREALQHSNLAQIYLHSTRYLVVILPRCIQVCKQLASRSGLEIKIQLLSEQYWTRVYDLRIESSRTGRRNLLWVSATQWCYHNKRVYVKDTLG